MLVTGERRAVPVTEGPDELALSRGVEGRRSHRQGIGHGSSGSQDQHQSLEGCLCLPVQSWTGTQADCLQVSSRTKLRTLSIPNAPTASPTTRRPQPLLDGESCGRAGLRTSKPFGLQLLIPDDSGSDPQLLSNLADLLDTFMEKTTGDNEEARLGFTPKKSLSVVVRWERNHLRGQWLLLS